MCLNCKFEDEKILFETFRSKISNPDYHKSRLSFPAVVCETNHGMMEQNLGHIYAFTSVNTIGDIDCTTPLLCTEFHHLLKLCCLHEHQLKLKAKLNTGLNLLRYMHLFTNPCNKTSYLDK